MDVYTFFSRIRGDLIDLITRELTDLNSVRYERLRELGSYRNLKVYWRPTELS